ncbi:aspartic peptidase A1 [Melampsora larici-populina 98AG31]|uniref:Aspartic peptidase A1 n=1 Tax=Melampsora larici-populina (strain 98AG31 / pathotype 3-4-7) TaxID=747676 RepID=F4S6Z3_MELLP|nr:aspartic peptidase A1 [Melampsora larici-populina 98AG31]EGF99545.1 aspartic peptidase A1 [Melampsora larici-populina 98AG31]
MKTRWILHFPICVLLSQSIRVQSKVSIPLTNAINLFTVSIGIGDPSTIHHLVINTGSLVTWCGAITLYIPSPVGFDGYDGLMGLNAVPWESNPNLIIETQTVMVNMWKRGLIQKNMFAVSGKPTKSMKPENNGMMTFGGYEPSLIIGEMYWYDCYSGRWLWTEFKPK